MAVFACLLDVGAATFATDHSHLNSVCAFLGVSVANSCTTVGGLAITKVVDVVNDLCTFLSSCLGGELVFVARNLGSLQRVAGQAWLGWWGSWGAPDRVTTVLNNTSDKLTVVVEPCINAKGCLAQDEAITGWVLVVGVATSGALTFWLLLLCTSFGLQGAGTSSDNTTTNSHVAVRINCTFLHVGTVDHLLGNTELAVQLTDFCTLRVGAAQGLYVLCAALYDIKVATTC